MLPNSVFEVFYQGKKYSKNDILNLIEIESSPLFQFRFCSDTSAQNLYDFNDNKAHTRSKGNISNALLILNLILFGILAFIITLIIL